MFGPTGSLVANGPHVPMHLGSMQETVKYQVYYKLACLMYCNNSASLLLLDFKFEQRDL